MAQPTSVAGAESVGTPGLDRHRLLAKGAHDSIGLGVVAGEVENNMRTQLIAGPISPVAREQIRPTATRTPRKRSGAQWLF
jgi:hypothetical protein